MKRLIVIVACLALLACGKPPRPDAVSAAEFPEFLAWVEYATASATDEVTRATARALPMLAEALANLDAVALERELAETFVPHNPMLGDGRAGLLSLAAEEGAPRGGAPNLMAGTAHVLVEGQLVLIHRVGRIGPLQSIAFDLLRLQDNGQLAEHWSFQQPMEAGFIDNLLFSFVVPRQLDLIPTSNLGVTDIWSDLPQYAQRPELSAAAVQANNLLVTDYLQQLYAGTDAGLITERFLSEDFTLHVSGIEPGRESYRQVLDRAVRRPSAASIEIQLAQNDLVWVLSRIAHIREADVPEIASADLFRVRDGMIVEQWRVVQPSPRFSRNHNGLF